MSVISDSPAVAFARAHMEAYSNHDLDTARRNVAEDVQLYSNDAKEVGIEPYLGGLTRFMAMFELGSLNILAARGDDRKAMVMAEVTVGGRPFPSARIFQLNGNGKIAVERVIFFEFEPQSA